MEWGVLTIWAVGLSEPVAFLCLGCSLPGLRLLMWKRDSWLLCAGLTRGRVGSWARGSCLRRCPALSLPCFCFCLFLRDWVAYAATQVASKASNSQLLYFPTFSLPSPATSVYFQTLGAMYFLFKRGYFRQRTQEGSFNLGFLADTFLPTSLKSLVSCCFGDGI